MKKFLVLICCIGLLAGALAGCGGSADNGGDPAEESNTGAEKVASAQVVVGCTAKPHAEILEVVQPLLAEEGIDLKIEEFTDYVLINPALDNGEIDANFFQHTPYLDDYNAKNDSELTVVAKVHNEPMGVYSKQIEDLEQLKDGVKVAIPNDATNGGRALMVLELAGLIELDPDAGVTAVPADITSNPKNLEVVMMDAAMLPRTLDDKSVAIAVINSNYALEASLNPVEDAIFMEPKDSPFANVLVVKPENVDNENIQKLCKALQSEEVRQFLEETYAGACVPAF